MWVKSQGALDESNLVTFVKQFNVRKPESFIQAEYFFLIRAFLVVIEYKRNLVCLNDGNYEP